MKTFQTIALPRLLGRQAYGPDPYALEDQGVDTGLNELINEAVSELSPVKVSQDKREDNIEALREAFGIASSYEDYVAVGRALISVINANRRLLRRFSGFDVKFFAGVISQASTRRRRTVTYKGALASCQPVECVVGGDTFNLYAIFNENNIAFRLVSDLGVSDVVVIAFVGKNAKPACFCGRELVSFESAKNPDYEPCVLNSDGTLVNLSYLAMAPVSLYGGIDYETLSDTVSVISSGRF